VSECQVCRGSRHVWDKEAGSWVSCECLQTERALARYRSAGVPTWLEGMTWRSFLDSHQVSDPATLLRIAAKLRRGELPCEGLLVHGRPSRSRTTAAALVLRSACDAGLGVHSVTIPALIDIEFDRDRSHPEALEADVLSIRCGGEPAHKWNGYVLEKVFRSRATAGLFTMVVADRDPGRLEALYRSGTVADTLRQFVKTRVAPEGVE